MASGFLGRWSQRKADARGGKPLDEVQQEGAPSQTGLVPDRTESAHAAVPVSTNTEPVTVPDAPPAPTLQDTQALGLESDYKPFVARGVDPAVRNAAMKKLFADPHFNVMDGLDTYIDDYSQPDPLPLSMLQKMASAQFLNLLADEPQPEPQPAAPPANPSPDHANTDLRLQQDDAAGPPGAGPGTE